MRLTAQARIFLPGDEVFAPPGLLDKLRHFLGADVDLRTGEIALRRDALLLTQQVARALKIAGIDNAVSLLVDDETIFVDEVGEDDDAGLLVAAMEKASERFSRGFSQVRAVFEHTEHGLDTLVEVTINKVHHETAPSATFAFGGRIAQLRPHPDEELQVARDRIGALLADEKILLTAKVTLDGLVDRVLKGCRVAFPRGRSESEQTEVSLRKPGLEEMRELPYGLFFVPEHGRAVRATPQQTTGGVFDDPWHRYYDDPLDSWATLHVLHAMTDPLPRWGYSAGHLGTHWHNAGVHLPILNSRGDALTEGIYASNSTNAAYFAGISSAVEADYSTGSWEDDTLELYTAGEEAAGTWDCSAPVASTSSSSGSWDCSSDCSWDCSSDCSWDCSSDCSWDCSSDCSGWD